MEEGCRQTGCPENPRRRPKSSRGVTEESGRSGGEVCAGAPGTRKRRAAVYLEARASSPTSAKFAERSGRVLGCTRRATKGKVGGVAAARQRSLDPGEENRGRGPSRAEQENERRRNTAYRAENTPAYGQERRRSRE